MLKKSLNTGGKKLAIESRMLDSISETISLAEMSEQDIRDAKKLPTFRDMIRELKIDDFAYTSIQRMGSHMVHGTWADLVFHYLERRENQFVPRDHEIEMEDVQFIFPPTLVVNAISAFLNYISSESATGSGRTYTNRFLTHLEHVLHELERIRDTAWHSDFVQEKPP